MYGRRVTELVFFQWAYEEDYSKAELYYSQN